jgi:hypothetical protein
VSGKFIDLILPPIHGILRICVIILDTSPAELSISDGFYVVLVVTYDLIDIFND